MADVQTNSLVPVKRRRICEECIQIHLKLIKTEGQLEALTVKSSKQVSKINDQANQIKELLKTVKQLQNQNKQLEKQIQEQQRQNQLKNEIDRKKYLVSIMQKLLILLLFFLK